MQVMTTANPRWKEFIERLNGPEGCNFRQDPNDPDNIEKVTWTCAGGKNKDLAAAILRSMDDVEVQASLEFFEAHGGYCDCEILFNVDGGA